MVRKPDACAICDSKDNLADSIVGSITVVVCETCLKKSIDNFVFLCLECNTSIVKNKQMVITETKDIGLKRAYLECAEKEMIVGMSSCIKCNYDEIVNVNFDYTDKGAEC